MKVSKKIMVAMFLLIPIFIFAEDAVPTVESNAKAIADVQTNQWREAQCQDSPASRSDRDRARDLNHLSLERSPP